MPHIVVRKSATIPLGRNAAGKDVSERVVDGAFLRIVVWLRDNPEISLEKKGKRDEKEFRHWAGKLGIGISPVDESCLIFQAWGLGACLERLVSFPWIRKWEFIMTGTKIPVFAAGSVGKD